MMEKGKQQFILLLLLIIIHNNFQYTSAHCLSALHVQSKKKGKKSYVFEKLVLKNFSSRSLLGCFSSRRSLHPQLTCLGRFSYDHERLMPRVLRFCLGPLYRLCWPGHSGWSVLTRESSSRRWTVWIT